MNVLVLTILVNVVSSSTVYTVRPDGTDGERYTEHTYTLSELYDDISSNTTLQFLPGQYWMAKNFTIEGVGNVYWKGNQTVINCGPFVGIALLNITRLTVQNITFANCGRDYGQHYVARIHSKQIENYPFHGTWNVAMLVNNCQLVDLSNITIKINTGTQGIVGLNVMDTFSLRDVRIIVKPGNKSVLTKGGVFYHYTWANTNITIDNFQYIIESQQALTSLVLEIILLQESHKVIISIQNTKFINMRNSTALYYYAGSYSSTAQNTLVLENVHVSNNLLPTTGKQVLFYIILQGGGFIFKTYKPSGYRHNIHINNSFIEANNNMDTIIYIKLKETLITMVNISIYNCKVFNNSNSEFLVTESEVENVWQLTHSITLSHTNISHNRNIMGSDHLMSFENGEVTFEDGVTVHNNSYYESIIRLRFAVLWLHGHVVFSTNVAYRLFKTLENSYFVFEEGVVLQIHHNTLHHVFKRAEWEEELLLTHLNGKQMCRMQFYSPRGNLDIEFKQTNLNYTIEVMYNLFELTKSLYDGEIKLTFSRVCRWLANKSFKVINSTSVFRKFLHVNNSKEVKIKSNAIPSKICQCSSGKDKDCDYRLLGSVFPGQTLKVNLMVPSLAAQYALKVVTLNNIAEEMCIIDSVSELYQQPNNVTCGEYSYTIKHHSLTVEKCELYLSTQQHDTEIFYVGLKPCPPGFILKDKICSCDPLLQSKYLRVQTCDLNTGTILRPGKSWIAVASNKSSKYTYLVTVNCPFDYCVPDDSQLDLHYPDNQCQFDRTGFLCGQCKEGLSAVFGSSQCKKCSNYYLFIIVPGIITSIVLVAAMFIFNLTVTHGAINTAIFYIDVIGINNELYYQSHNAFTVSPSIFEFCFYNGLTGYVKIWIYLSYPAVLGIIAFAIVTGSRYSPAVQRLTAQRALPVLATLFVLTYTGVIQAVSTVLYSYTTITELPANHTTIVWSVDASVHMHSKHIILFIVSAAFIVVLLTFSGVLLFARPLLRFRVISTFKPLLDTYFGPYKDKAYFWVGLQLVVRWLIFHSVMLDQDTTLMACCILIGSLLCLQGLMQPFKSKYLNVQESLVLFNILAVNVVTIYDHLVGNGVGVVVNKVLIFGVLLYFATFLITHCIMQLCGKSINHRRRLLEARYTAWKKKITHRTSSTPNMIEMNRLKNIVPDVTYNYREFREPLVELDE